MRIHNEDENRLAYGLGSLRWHILLYQWTIINVCIWCSWLYLFLLQAIHKSQFSIKKQYTKTYHHAEYLYLSILSTELLSNKSPVTMCGTLTLTNICLHHHYWWSQSCHYWSDHICECALGGIVVLFSFWNPVVHIAIYHWEQWPFSFNGCLSCCNIYYKIIELFELSHKPKCPIT